MMESCYCSKLKRRLFPHRKVTPCWYGNCNNLKYRKNINYLYLTDQRTSQYDSNYPNDNSADNLIESQYVLNIMHNILRNMMYPYGDKDVLIVFRNNMSEPQVYYELINKIYQRSLLTRTIISKDKSRCIKFIYRVNADILLSRDAMCRYTRCMIELESGKFQLRNLQIKYTTVEYGSKESADLYRLCCYLTKKNIMEVQFSTLFTNIEKFCHERMYRKVYNSHVYNNPIYEKIEVKLDNSVWNVLFGSYYSYINEDIRLIANRTKKYTVTNINLDRLLEIQPFLFADNQFPANTEVRKVIASKAWNIKNYVSQENLKSCYHYMFRGDPDSNIYEQLLCGLCKVPCVQKEILDNKDSIYFYNYRIEDNYRYVFSITPCFKHDLCVSNDDSEKYLKERMRNIRKKYRSHNRRGSSLSIVVSVKNVQPTQRNKLCKINRKINNKNPKIMHARTNNYNSRKRQLSA